MSMIYRLAAAFALTVDLLIAGHVIELPLLHKAGPLAVTGVAFIVAFVLSELFDVIAQVVTWWRDHQ